MPKITQKRATIREKLKRFEKVEKVLFNHSFMHLCIHSIIHEFHHTFHLLVLFILFLTFASYVLGICQNAKVKTREMFLKSKKKKKKKVEKIRKKVKLKNIDQSINP